MSVTDYLGDVRLGNCRLRAMKELHPGVVTSPLTAPREKGDPDAVSKPDLPSLSGDFDHELVV